MMEHPSAAWAGLVCLVALSTALAYLVSRAVPWRSMQHRDALILPTALALAPFLLGILCIGAGMVGRNFSPLTQLWIVIGALLAACVAILKWVALTPATTPTASWKPRSLVEFLLLVLLLISVADLLFLAIRLPLTENDALEYGLVGRAIYEAHTLQVYPLLDADATASGLFAPWTHPPLYPSLIALTYAIQGTAEQADLMKLIAPWFTLGAACGLLGLGRLHSRQAGWLTGLLFLTIPLLIAGAQSSAIDALPISGMVLVLIALAGIDRRGFKAAVCIGGMLGMALWTHSQAILYVPILAAVLITTGGLNNARHSASLAGKALLVAGLVAAYPYLRNIAIYGTPISDNPAVFALKSLDWDGFFRYARSIYDWSTRLQYGLLKGFIALHSYGLVFWMAAISIFYLVVTRVASRRGWRSAFDTGALNPADQTPVVALHILAVYFGGIVASLIVGTDLMIKNDRYLLVIGPAVALLGAWGVAELFGSRGANLARPRGAMWTAARAGLCILIVGHTGAFLLYGNMMQWLQLVEVTSAKPVETSEGPRRSWPVLSMKKDPLLAWNGIQLVKHMPDEVPADARILAIHPADFYYTDRKMLSYLDPRMVPLYGESEPAAFAKELQELGVRYVQVPGYLIPPASHSSLLPLLSDPGLADLVVDSSFSQLYRLRTKSASARAHKVPVGSQNLFDQTWVEYPKVGVGGPAFAIRKWSRGVVAMPDTAESTTSILPRSYSHMLEAGDEVAGKNPVPPIQVQPGKEYVLRLNVEGEGYIRVWIWKGDGVNPDAWRQVLAGDFALSPQTPRFDFSRRMLIDDNETRLRIGIERYGISRLSVRSASLVELGFQ